MRHNRVPAPQALLTTALAYARERATGPTRAMGLLKQCIYGGWERPLAEGLELARRAVFEVIETQDAREGLTAFLEKAVAAIHGAVNGRRAGGGHA